MLAQNFRTAAELDITPEMATALQKVLVRLETGDLVHVTCPHYNTLPNGFNMGFEWNERECGTAGCLLGWAAAELRQPWYQLVGGLPSLLRSLFYPCYELGCSIDYDEITTEQVAIVLRHYLTTGEINWRLIPIKFELQD